MRADHLEGWDRKHQPGDRRHHRKQAADAKQEQDDSERAGAKMTQQPGQRHIIGRGIAYQPFKDDRGRKSRLGSSWKNGSGRRRFVHRLVHLGFCASAASPCQPSLAWTSAAACWLRMLRLAFFSLCFTNEPMPNRPISAGYPTAIKIDPCRACSKARLGRAGSLSELAHQTGLCLAGRCCRA
jgi:hypothetical protein